MGATRGGHPTLFGRSRARGPRPRLTPPEDLVPVARPFMRALWETFGETVNLGIPIGARVLYLDLIESRQRLKTTSRVGSSDPLRSTALGALLLSTERDPRTSRTRVDPDLLLEDLEATRVRGYAVDDEENEIGSRCVASAVLDAEDRPVAALSVSAPTVRFDDGRLALAGQAVIRSSRELSAAIGLPKVSVDAPRRVVVLQEGAKRVW